MLHNLGSGRLVEIKKGVEEGWIDVHELNPEGGNALCVSMPTVNAEYIDYMVSKGVSPDGDGKSAATTPILRSIQFCNLEITERLFNSGARIDVVLPNGMNIWHVVARSGGYEHARWLKEIGAPGINDKCKTGFTPLACAVTACRSVVDIEALLAAGAEVGKLSDRYSALAIALASATNGDRVRLLYTHYLKERAGRFQKAKKPSWWMINEVAKSYPKIGEIVFFEGGFDVCEGENENFVTYKLKDGEVSLEIKAEPVKEEEKPVAHCPTCPFMCKDPKCNAPLTPDPEPVPEPKPAFICRYSRCSRFGVPHEPNKDGGCMICGNNGRIPHFFCKNENCAWFAKDSPHTADFKCIECGNDGKTVVEKTRPELRVSIARGVPRVVFPQAN